MSKRVLARVPERIYEKLYHMTKAPWKEVVTIADFTGKSLSKLKR